MEYAAAGCRLEGGELPGQVPWRNIKCPPQTGKMLLADRAREVVLALFSKVQDGESLAELVAGVFSVQRRQCQSGPTVHAAEASLDNRILHSEAGHSAHRD